MFLRILDRLEEILIASLMAARDLHHLPRGDAPLSDRRSLPLSYLFPINLSWAQELCIYMFVWVAKFGAAYGVRTGIHVGVDVLVNQLKSPWRNMVVLFGLFCGAFFTAVIGTMGAKFVIGLMSTDQVSPDLEIPSWLVYLCIPLGSYLMCFRFLQVAFDLLAHRRTAASRPRPCRGGRCRGARHRRLRRSRDEQRCSSSGC